MRILIVNQYYWPEEYGAGVEVRELAEALQRSGYQVTVVTGLPNYPYGKVWEGYRWPPFRSEAHQGVRVLRGWFYPTSRSSNSTRRGISAVSFGLSALLMGVFSGKPDIVLGYSSPIFTGLAALFLARWNGVPCVLNLKDLFTCSIISSGLSKAGNMLRLLLAMEKFLYQHVDRIIANATHFKDYLLNLGIARGKICLISDWADGEFIHPMSSHNAVRANWGLGDDFVILYSGNMGYSSDLETVMRAAHLLKDLQGVKFVLVGDGVKLERLKSMRAEFELSNVQFEPLQPRRLLPDVLACANVALVTLSEAGGRASTQGKLYSIMAAGRAVVAVSSTDHDIRRIVEEQNCGWWSPAGDAALLALLLRKLVDEQEQVVIKGIQARQSFDEHYSLDVCTRQFEEVFMQLMQTRISGEMHG